MRFRSATIINMTLSANSKHCLIFLDVKKELKKEKESGIMNKLTNNMTTFPNCLKARPHYLTVRTLINVMTGF